MNVRIVPTQAQEATRVTLAYLDEVLADLHNAAQFADAQDVAEIAIVAARVQWLKRRIGERQEGRHYGNSRRRDQRL